MFSCKFESAELNMQLRGGQLSWMQNAETVDHGSCDCMIPIERQTRILRTGRSHYASCST